MDCTDEVVFEHLPFIRTYKSGRVKRLCGTEMVPASVDSGTGVSSKDVMIDPESGVFARLYLPKIIDDRKKKLAIVVYYHGGGFCVGSAASPVYHGYLNTLASQADVLVVSVDYRLAPEHPLPTAYDDSWLALQWVLSQVNNASEPWLAEYGDSERVFLAGDSAGGNIAHNMVVRARCNGFVDCCTIRGMILIHPFFWGTKPIALEASEPAFRAKMEEWWTFLCPSAASSDDPQANPFASGAPSLSALRCERVLVCIAEMDFLRERGRAYFQELKARGGVGQVELIESAGEGHVFFLFKPACEKALLMMKRMVAFLNDD